MSGCRTYAHPGGCMNTTRSIRRGAALLAGLALFGVASLAAGQVPAKPVPKDTAAKPKPTVTKKAPIKIVKEATAGGEVVPVIEISKPCDTVIKTIVTFDPK